MKDWAARFADQLLKDNLQLEEFQVSLVGYDHFDEIVERLKEIGCSVQVDAARRRLIVTCPTDKGGASPSEGNPPSDKKRFRPIDLPVRVRKRGLDLARKPKATVAATIMSLISADVGSGVDRLYGDR